VEGREEGPASVREDVPREERDPDPRTGVGRQARLGVFRQDDPLEVQPGFPFCTVEVGAERAQEPLGGEEPAHRSTTSLNFRFPSRCRGS
jgi:hypothetical protein